MMKENAFTYDQDEQATNMDWLRVLEFGADVVAVKTNSQSRQVEATAFIVLP